MIGNGFVNSLQGNLLYIHIIYTFVTDNIILALCIYRFRVILTKVKVASRKLKQQQEAVGTVYDSMIALNLLVKLRYQDQPQVG